MTDSSRRTFFVQVLIFEFTGVPNRPLPVLLGLRPRGVRDVVRHVVCPSGVTQLLLLNFFFFGDDRLVSRKSPNIYSFNPGLPPSSVPVNRRVDRGLGVKSRGSQDTEGVHATTTRICLPHDLVMGVSCVTTHPAEVWSYI